LKLRILAACAALTTLTLTAGQALAAEPVTAKLAAPIAEKTKLIAGGAIFQCEADTCVALAPSAQTFAVATCRTLASKLGPVQSFSGRKALEGDRLAACNEKALGAGGATIAKK
jgi:hypothetical protein